MTDAEGYAENYADSVLTQHGRDVADQIDPEMTTWADIWLMIIRAYEAGFAQANQLASEYLRKLL